MVVSVADTVVTRVARLGSFGPVLQRVRQNRVDAACELLAMPGICSQQSVVRKARPGVSMSSSLPSSWTVAVPADTAGECGLGPQATPQSPMFHRSLIAAALHVPDSVGGGSA